MREQDQKLFEAVGKIAETLSQRVTELEENLIEANARLYELQELAYKVAGSESQVSSDVLVKKCLQISYTVALKSIKEHIKSKESERGD